ncbi:hypothetical protein KKC88_00885 [Patescibacteria group bacterium]|nr:hypothetical protein [Patescibacteria group bacterium]MBU1673314.1 hypothetical protein [Patescibacteria group bacterium]MBU1963567.1 hypothetical protein [Patescibacteria group bacterium]
MSQKVKSINNLGPLSTLLAKTAIKQGAKIKVISLPAVFWVIKGTKKWLFFGVYTPLNKLPGGKIADNKKLTKKIWQEAKIPIAQDLVVTPDNYKKLLSKTDINFPVVAKPMAGTLKGIGVVTNIRTKKTLGKIVKKLFIKGHHRVLVEEFYSGLNDYRVLVLKGKIIAVARRIPPFVVGDGKGSIKKLLEEKNAERKKSKEIKLGLIKVDEEMKMNLKNQKLSLKSVPKVGETICVKNVCNLGAGGEVEDVTSKICKYNKDLAIKAAEVMDLELAGLDFLCDDIAKPLKKGKGILLEVNEHPDIALHHFPQIGRPKLVADQIIKEILKQK